MATIKSVKIELRHRRGAEEIAECQSSGMKIKEWCQMKGIQRPTIRVYPCGVRKKCFNRIQYRIFAHCKNTA